MATIPQWLSEQIEALTPAQRAFVLSNDKVASYVAGNGGGKTHAGIIRCLRLAYKHPGIILLACDATTDEAAALLFEKTLYYLHVREVAGANSATRELTLTNGSRLAFHHLLYGKRLNDMMRGLICDAVYLDNNEYLSYRDFLTLFLRTRRHHAPDLLSPVCYTGEVEWRHWRDVHANASPYLLRLTPGRFTDVISEGVEEE
ncbi:MAG: hypothetical protein ACXWQ5_00710 [Ktedonobacterales bacterium]